MKPMSVEMACLLGIQNEIQAMWNERLGKKSKHKEVSNQRSCIFFYEMRIFFHKKAKT